MDQIVIGEGDFEKAMRSMTPSTHRVQDQIQSPLPPEMRPLLSGAVERVCADVDRIMPGAAAAAAGATSQDGIFRPRDPIQ